MLPLLNRHFYTTSKIVKFYRAGAYMDDRILGSCRPAIFNFAVVQFFRKKFVVQFQTRFFITRKCQKLAMFYFWNIGNRCYTKPGIRLAFHVSFTLKQAKNFSFRKKFHFGQKRAVVQFSCRPDMRPL